MRFERVAGEQVFDGKLFSVHRERFRYEDGDEADLEGYASSGLPARTMGRSIEDDELFFKAALAGGAVLAEEV